MIEMRCECGGGRDVAESEIGKAEACPKCGKVLHLVAAEELPPGSGTADFDARLLIASGPAHVGEQFLLGGVVDIQIGKLEGKAIQLEGSLVSRNHCRLVRVDFGPSRWEIKDEGSRNGMFINGARTAGWELKDGDLIRIGEYELKYAYRVAEPVPVAQVASTPLAAKSGGKICPSCGKEMARGAKICVDCGIYVESGRALVTAKGMDEDVLAIRADTWIRLISWIIWFGLYPVASEAFGAAKSRATWAIFILTAAISLPFIVVGWANHGEMGATADSMMLWSGDAQAPRRLSARQKQIVEQLRQAVERERKWHPGAGPRDMTDEELEEAEGVLAEIDRGPTGERHWYQYLTHALLHGGVMHLAGNMLFFLVFGLRVNQLVGDLKMAIVYPILAVAAGASHVLATMHEPMHPMLGASGAIMGLAGMYFVFFPVHKVHMAIWLRGGIFTGWRCFYKVFQMRGFWLLVFWVGLNDVLMVALGVVDGTAHWAHLGGFVSGMAIAIGLLVARQVNARGGDLLTVILGKHAWALLGKPTQWKAAPAIQAVSMSYPE